MEFRNHQARIGQYFTVLRGNPLGLVLVILLIPLFLGAVVFFGLLAIVGLLLSFVFNSVLGIFGMGGRTKTVFTTRSTGPSNSPSREGPPPGTGPTIDVEVVRRDD